MKKSKLEIYALAVCFVSVICFAVATSIGVYNLIQITKPTITLSSWEYEKHQSNDSYWNRTEKYCGDIKDKRTRLSENELTKERLESYGHSLKIEQRNGTQSLIIVLIVSVINSIVFFIHWRIAKKERQSTNAD